MALKMGVGGTRALAHLYIIIYGFSMIYPYSSPSYGHVNGKHDHQLLDLKIVRRCPLKNVRR